MPYPEADVSMYKVKMFRTTYQTFPTRSLIHRLLTASGMELNSWVLDAQWPRLNAARSALQTKKLQGTTPRQGLDVDGFPPQLLITDTGQTLTRPSSATTTPFQHSM